LFFTGFVTIIFLLEAPDKRSSNIAKPKQSCGVDTDNKFVYNMLGGNKCYEEMSARKGEVAGAGLWHFRQGLEEFSLTK
jgi:hypothetical protein